MLLHPQTSVRCMQNCHSPGLTAILTGMLLAPPPKSKKTRPKRRPTTVKTSILPATFRGFLRTVSQEAFGL